MFIIILKYKKSIEDVMNNLDDHKNYLEKYYSLNKFICSGRQEPRCGGIILCNAKDKTEVNLIIKQDPFYKNNIAKYEIIEFIPTNYADGFKEFII
ncbi:YciI family protein [Clostridium akagii]|uniref:YciI family protein n=1 Tax=Clostridium akagii TaxID=91623 RepID=UPI00047AE436|nr:YciI family protein [Clostridium akagii]